MTTGSTGAASGDRPTLVLLPSPLLGPAVWRPAARVLRSRNVPVAEVEAPAVTPGTPSEVAEWLLDSVPVDHPVILVPHSNAGLFVPAMVSAREVVGAVFVDAVLPPSRGEVPTAPAELVDQLAVMADEDGLLPEWTRWWDAAEVAALFPDRATRQAVEAEGGRLPLSYFREVLEVPSGWDRGLQGAYLAFGGTYAAEVADAIRRGWPTNVLEGAGHLHMLIDPEGVADTVAASVRWP